MWTFIFAGLLYLTGVGVILVLKPSFMFTPDGNWKEFGIGKNESRYTPFTFWLFCLVWALVSYIIVLLISPLFENKFPTVRRRVKFENNSDLVFEDEISEQAQHVQNDMPSESLPRGYYVLNRKASKLAGVPKYVYLGEEP